MTRIEAIKYGVECYKNRTSYEEPTMDVIYEKDGEFKAGTWGDEASATANGWKYAGCLPNEARALGLI